MPDVCLTFDNGPTPEVTPQVLDILARRGLSCTFFVIGQLVATREGRALAERAVAEGHWIGNHTWSHDIPLGLLDDPIEVEREIEDTQRAIGDLAHPDRFFRPHGGGAEGPRLLNSAAVDLLVRGQYSCVLWTAVPRESRNRDTWVELALEACTAAERTLLVLHDKPVGVMPHLDRFLGAALDAGVRFVQPIPEECMPIRRGEIVGDLAPIMSDRLVRDGR